MHTQVFGIEDFAKLPPRAVVAFAARCGRRGQPLYGLWAAAKSEDVRVVDNALALAEAYARTETATDATRADLAAEAAYRAAARAAAAARAGVDKVALTAAHAGAAAHAAADAAADAPDDPVAARLDALYAVRASVRAGGPAAATAAKQDLEALESLALETPSEQGNVIDSTARGPLGPYWPNREPDR